MSDNKKKNEDMDVHPSAYRDSMNEKVCPKINNEIKCQPQKQCNSSDEWDLYPQVIRKIENEGSQDDVEQLHKMERTLSH